MSVIFWWWLPICKVLQRKMYTCALGFCSHLNWVQCKTRKEKNNYIETNRFWGMARVNKAFIPIKILCQHIFNQIRRTKCTLWATEILTRFLITQISWSFFFLKRNMKLKGQAFFSLWIFFLMYCWIKIQCFLLSKPIIETFLGNSFAEGPLQRSELSTLYLWEAKTQNHWGARSHSVLVQAEPWAVKCPPAKCFLIPDTKNASVF